MAAKRLTWLPPRKRRSPSGKTTTDQRVFRPSALEYATATGKEVLMVLESASKAIPVPLLQSAIKLALDVVAACEDASLIERRAEEVKNRVSNLMVGIVNNVTSSPKDISNETIRKAVEGIEQDVENLMSTLETIMRNLEELEKQNRFLLVFFRDLNKTKIDDCLSRLASALEKFNVSNDLRNLNILQDIQLRLDKIQVVTEHVADDVGLIKVTLQQVLDKLDNATPHSASNSLIRQEMPIMPRIFHGRDNLVQEITLLFDDKETSRVCVLGPGGMGKTSLSLAVVESLNRRATYASSLCFWVPCVEASSAAVFLQLLHLHLRISRATNDPFTDILLELKKSSERRLILLDNFETLWNTVDGTRNAVTNIVGQLAKIRHVGIFVTMRGVDPPCDDIEWQKISLRNVDKEAARLIFHQVHPKSKNDPDVDDLLVALGFMPFAVVLMAKLGRKSLSSAKDLLRQWTEDGTNMISGSRSPEDNMNRSIALSVDLIQQDLDAISLLEILSLLPGGTTRTNLSWWAPKLKSSAIAVLSDAALLLTNEDSDSTTLFVLPVIQSFMLQRIPDSVHQRMQKACCQYVLDHVCRYYDPRFKESSKKLAAEDTNIQSLLLSSTPHVPFDILFEALLPYTWYRYDTQQSSVSIAQHTVDLARRSGDNHCLALALHSLGSTYRTQSKFVPALLASEEANELFDNLPDVDPTGAECCLLIAVCKLLTTLSLPNLSLATFIRNAQSKYGPFLDDFRRARLQKVLGWCLCGDIANDAAILECLEEAKGVFIRGNYLADAIESTTFLAEHYYDTFRYAEGLAVIERAQDIVKRASARGFLAYIHLTRGMLLISLGRHLEAHPDLEYSLIVYEDMKSLLGIAQSMECFGWTYMARGDYEDATSAYERAKKTYLEMDQQSTALDGIERCNWNLAAIKRKEQRPEEDIQLFMLHRHPPRSSQ